MRLRLGEIVPHLVPYALFPLSPKSKRSIERRLRGREECRKLRLADCAIVSWGKSGRTWLRLMLSRFYQVTYGLPESSFLEFDNFHARNAAIPRVFFTHGNYLRDYTGHWDSKIDFYGKKVVLLVRDPRDVAVSQYFQWKFRMRPAKKFLNDYPAHGADVSIFEFVFNHPAGLRRIIEFFNGWASEMTRLQDILVVRYEDMRSDPGRALKQIVDFIGSPGTDAAINEAVAFASYDNMKKLEERKVFWSSGKRLVPGDRANPDSFKVRRAKVGGYRDYFEEEEVRAIDELVASELAPMFGYRASALTAETASARARRA